MAFRYVLALEAIGDDSTAYLRAVRRGQVRPTFEREQRAHKLGARRPWVAEITGLDSRAGLARRFLVAKRDYSAANGAGSRGVMLYYLLDEGGIYEVHARLTWQRSERYFIRIVNGEAERLDQEDVLRCLSARLA